MKKIYMGLFMFLAVFHLISQEQKAITLNITPLIGWVNGYGDEIVYRKEGSDDKLSQLKWNMEPLFYLGIGIDFNWQMPKNFWGLFTDASFKSGFPLENGTVEDKDWASSYYADFLTHYSVHGNQTDKAIIINANIGARFSISNIVSKVFFAYDYMSFSWTAKGGSFLYPENEDGSGGHGYLVNKEFEVGTYSQTWHIISPAISFYGTINDYFNTEISLKLSPFIWCNAEENHILRQLVITDNMNSGFFVEPKFIFSFTPKNFTLSLSVAYRNINNTRGNGKYDYSDGTTQDVNDMLGAGYSAFDIGIILKFKPGRNNDIRNYL
jgi:outer membrane protease